MSTHEDEYLRVRVEARRITERHHYGLVDALSGALERHQAEIANVIMKTRITAIQEVLIELTDDPRVKYTESFIAGTEWAISKIRKFLERKE